MNRLFVFLNYPRFLLHILVFKLWGEELRINGDLRRWRDILRPNKKINSYTLIDILLFFPEYRNLFYFRTKGKNRIFPRLLAIFASPLPTLGIGTEDLGEGCYIQHGFGVCLGGRKIGKNAWINQNVTVGFSNANEAPTLGDNVIIGAGAVIVGKVKVGNNAKIGANSLVVRNVPENALVVGVPAKLICIND